MIDPHDQTPCPKCHRLFCEGYWGEGVCISDMHFGGEPTADGDAVASYLRVWYEAHRESAWERSRFNPKGRRWEGPWADEFMLGLINEVYRIHSEEKRQLAAKAHTRPADLIRAGRIPANPKRKNHG